MRIIDKMLKAYFHVAETMNEEGRLLSVKTLFHRTRKVAFSVVAEKLNKAGLLPGERPFIVEKKPRRGK